MARPRRVTVILNRASGPKPACYSPEEVRSALLTAGVPEVEIIALEPGLDVSSVIADRRCSGTDTVVAAGGDGTINTVSAALVDTETPLGVVPVGTLNHFASDVGIPAELEDAARTIAEGCSILVDVAKVNERSFVNNSSIGVYPAMVSARDALMKKGLSKRLATIGGATAALRGFPNTVVRLQSSSQEVVAKTPFVFIGNNAYEFSGLQAGKRKGLQDGTLQVCSVTDSSRLALFRSLVAAIAGKADDAPELALSIATQVRITTLRKRIPVAIDGEVVTMASPLVYSIHPGALTVLVPRKG